VAHEYYEYERWYVSASYIARTVCAQMSTASTGWWHVLALDTFQQLLECVSIIQCEDCMRANGYHKYELLACVSIIQREGCMRANEYRKYELLSLEIAVRLQLRSPAGLCRVAGPVRAHALSRRPGTQ